MSESKEKTGKKESQLSFIFAIGKQAFGLPPSTVLEVLSVANITRVPFTPDWVEGVISARGKVIPVIDLIGYFGIEQESKDARTRLIILGVGDISFGIACDRIIGMEEIETRALEETMSHLPKTLRDCSKAQVKREDLLIVLLDTKALLEQSRDRVQAG
ncbi:MAG: chemotaxis protein CheW [Deltaproteobacteria bacterium]|nr:chemotaxis protein CheW [Deltaproteobacteria bacterium]